MYESSGPQSGLADPLRPLMQGERFTQMIAGGEIVVRANDEGVGLSAGSDRALLAFMPWGYVDQIGSAMRTASRQHQRHRSRPQAAAGERGADAGDAADDEAAAGDMPPELT